MKWKIERLYPGIYHLNFAEHYDLCMHFVRYQEYYEGPEHREKIFTLLDYMEWYAEEHGKGGFTYASDWSGFNVPDWVLHQVRNADIPDLNALPPVDWDDVETMDQAMTLSRPQVEQIGPDVLLRYVLSEPTDQLEKGKQ